MDAASSVLAQVGNSAAETVEAVANLVAKSLVSADVNGAIAFYRLFDVMRTYSLQKLEASGERDRLARSHAEHYREVLERAQTDWETKPATEWLERHRHLIDNVRSALDWAFSPTGDPSTGVAITVGAVPLWFELSLTSECGERIDLALAAPPAHRSADSEMRLYATRAWSLMQTQGSVPATEDAWNRVLELSEQLGNADYQLRALWGLWAGLLNRNEFRSALAFAERFSELAARRSSRADFLVGERMIGYILHLMGDQTKARHHIEQMLGEYEVPVVGAQIIRFVFDQRATAQCFLARILWLQGQAERATSLTRRDRRRPHLPETTGFRCVKPLSRALVPSRFSSAILRRSSDTRPCCSTTRNGRLSTSGRRLAAAFVVFSRSDAAEIAEGLAMLGAALGELREIQFGVYYSVFLSEYADALSLVAQGGRGAEGDR